MHVPKGTLLKKFKGKLAKRQKEKKTDTMTEGKKKDRGVKTTGAKTETKKERKFLSKEM
jgi:hypothetical protein